MKPRRTARPLVLPVAVLFFVLVLACAAGPAGALVSTGDGSWFWRAPQPFGNWLVAAASMGDTVWAVGDGGTIAVSHDGGATWQAQRSGASLALLDIQFLDASEGWAVGGRPFGDSDYEVRGVNTILHTTDGGDTWQKQVSSGGSGLVALCVVDASHAWAVGSGGIVLSTSDGGATWVKRPTGVRTGLTAVHFSDALHGWVGGERGRLLRTSDGGRTWRALRLASWATRLRVLKPDFVDALHGYAIFGDPDGFVQMGSGRVVAATDDGGRTWRKIAWGAEFTAVGASSGAVWTAALVRDEAVQYALSTDGGVSWERQFVNGVLPDDIVGTAAAGACAVGYGGAFSSDDGRLWIPRSSWSYLPDMFASTGSSLIGVADVPYWMSGWTLGGLTSDDGVSWEYGGTIGKVMPFVMAALGEHAAVSGATADQAVVATTGDGGATWTTVATKPASLVFSFEFADDHRVWACAFEVRSEKPVLLASDDGGLTWQEQALPSGYSALSLDFISPLEGWGVFWAKTGAAIAHTTDGGATWAILPSASALGNFSQVQFVDAENGWAYSVERDAKTPVAIRTVDGGETWAEVATVFKGQRLGGMTFVDALNGWAWDVDPTDGDVWRTADGGVTWQQGWSGVGEGLLDLVLVGGVPFGFSPYIGVASTTDLPGDAAPPYTCDDFDRRAHRTPVSVKLTAGDLGGTVAFTEYRLDGGSAWLPYTAPVLFEAPADHSNDARHLLHMRSTDDSGNVESDYAVEVRIDTLGPATRVLKAATAKRGDWGRVPVRVDDAVSRWARVTLRLRRLGDGRRAAPIRSWVETNHRQPVWFRTRMAPGRYKVTVEAVDEAGNTQVRAGRGLLVVVPSGGARSSAARTIDGRAARAEQIPDPTRLFGEWLRERFGPRAIGLVEAVEAGLLGQSRSARSRLTVTNR